MNDEQKVVISIYQNCKTALQSIADLIKKTDDKEFIDLLNAQYSRYDDFCQKVEDYAKVNNIDLKDNSWFEKARLWTSIQMSTFTNDSTRHLAELMLMGTVMGTLTCYKTKADRENASDETIELLNELEKMEEKNFDELKKYLKNS